MGMSHASNFGCLDAFQKGIARSVEVMVPAPWYIEATKILNQHPEYDAGIHLVLNCEWNNLKWRPLTTAKSLTDSNGYFFPTPWKGSVEFPSLQDNHPDFSEAENELRAQIEMAKRHIPHLSHISTHMGFDDSHPELKKIVQRLSDEYRLPVIKNTEILNFPATKQMSSPSAAARVKGFIKQLHELQPGKTYLLVTHPCYNTNEMQTIATPTYARVGLDRMADLAMLTSKKVRRTLRKRNIKVVSIKEVIRREW
jgi:predicted glycoside hydrolase/deacetylase ChbG (UPF0249 family)